MPYKYSSFELLLAHSRLEHSSLTFRLVIYIPGSELYSVLLFDIDLDQMRKADLNYFSDNRRQNAEPVQELENEAPYLKLEEVRLDFYTMIPQLSVDKALLLWF